MSTSEDGPEKRTNSEIQDVETNLKIAILCQGQPRALWRRKLRRAFWPRTHMEMLKHRHQQIEFNLSPYTVDWFEWLALFIIIGNTVTLAMSDPLNPTSSLNRALDVLDLVFNSFFVIEVALRITSFGFVMFKADKWNVLDALIVISGVISAALQFFNFTPFSLTSLRSVRVLRPIRSLRQLESARLVITAAFSAIRSLADVTLLYVLFLVLMGVAGVSQYNSRLRTRCVNNMYFNSSITSEYPAFGVLDFVRFQAFEQAYNQPIHAQMVQSRRNWTCFQNLTLNIQRSQLNAMNSSAWANNATGECRPGSFDYDPYYPYAAPTFQEEMTFRATAPPNADDIGIWKVQACDGSNAVFLKGYNCPYSYSCLKLENPMYGFAGFDNLPQALLTLFISVTLELWFDTMYMTMDAVDPTAALYFVAVVILGAFFIINLSIVLITVEYQRCAAEEKNHPANSDRKSFAEWLKMKYNQIINKKKGPEYTTEIDEFGTPRQKPLLAGGPPALVIDQGAAGNDAIGAKRAPARRAKRSDGGGDEEMDPRDESPEAAAATARIDRQQAEQEQREAEAELQRLDEETRRRGFGPRRVVYGLLNSKIGKGISYGIIIANVLMMSVEHYGMSDAMVRRFKTGNLVFTIIYTIEMVLRIGCTPFAKYVRSPLNFLDVIIVVLSWVDYAVPDFNFAVVRAFRCFRLAKIFKDMPEMYVWIRVIIRSIRSAMVLVTMITFCLFIFACLGMHLFGGSFCDLASSSFSRLRPDNTAANCMMRPRLNYDGIVEGMVTSFVVMTGDNWELVMYDGMRARSAIFALFFVAFFIVSNYILLNLLIGILLSVRPADDEVDSDDDDDDDDATRHRKRMLVETISFKKKQVAEDKIPDIYLADGTRISAIQAHEDEDTRKDAQADKEQKQGTVLTFMSNVEDRFKSEVMKNVDKVTAGVQATQDTTIGPQYTTLQKKLQRFLQKGATQVVIMVVIVFSCFTLALESPTAAPDTTNANLIRIVDFGLNLVFVGEVLLSLLAYGVILKPWCYLRRDHWNKMDTILAITALAGEILTRMKKGDNTAGPLKALRVFRAVRPLRFVKRLEGLKVVVSTLYLSLKPLKNLLCIICMILTLWGIMGVQLFKGTFYRCSNEQIGTESGCLSAGFTWDNARMHFDHLGAAYLSLFTMATLENWTEIMFDGMDAVAPGIAPRTNHRQRNALYFIFFVIMGGVFFVNLIVSIIIDSYQKEKKASKLGSSIFLTPAQNAWIKTQHILINQIPLIDYDEFKRDTSFGDAVVRFRRRVRFLVRHPLFDVFIYCCIIINFLVMAIDQYPKPEVMRIFISICNTFFATLFAVEAAMKIISEGFKRYLSSKWNRFDFLIVCLSIVALLMEAVFSSASFAASFRTMRTLRLLRIIRKSRRLQIVLKKFLLALYSLNNVAAVVLLLFFIFGVLGMKLFGRVERGTVFTHNLNFDNILSAILLMLRISSGGDWVDVMEACRVQPPHCDAQVDGCGLETVTELYFVIFLTVGMFILVNLFVAVIMENFSNSTDHRGGTEYIDDSDGVNFFKLWIHFDPQRMYRIESKYLLTLLRSVPEECRLGMGKIPEKQRLRRELIFVDSLTLMEHNGMIELQELITCLCERAFSRGLNPKEQENDVKKRKKKEYLPPTKQHKLAAKTDRRFRKEEREYSRPDRTFDVNAAKRVAVMIFEAYYARHLAHVAQVKIWAAQRAGYQQRLDEEDERQRSELAEQKDLQAARAQAENSKTDQLLQSSDLNQSIMNLMNGGAEKSIIRRPEPRHMMSLDNDSVYPENQSYVSPDDLASHEEWVKPARVHHPVDDPNEYLL